MGKRVLIVHQGALGDVVLSLPALSRLKRQRDVSLTLLCGEQIGRVVQDMGLADRHYPLESRILSGMFEDRWDHETQRFCRDYDRIVVIGFSRALVARLREDFHGKIYWVPPRPAVEIQDHVATHIVNAFCHQGLLKKRKDSVGISLSDLVKEDLPRGGAGHYGHNGLTILHPGAGSRRKRWDVGGFKKVARAVIATGTGPAVFLIGPAEEELVKSLAAFGRKGPMRLSELERLSETGPEDFEWEESARYVLTQDLQAVVSLLGHATAFVGNDSGLTHLSAYLGIPTLAIFGPSSPLRWSPLGKRVRVLRGVDDCPPCFEVTTDNCDEPRCLSAISPTMILNGLKAVHRPGKDFRG